MTTFRITITRKPGLSDPEGTTTKKALSDLGFDGVQSVSFGRVLTVEINNDDSAAARAEVEQMCSKLLSNPVMESFSIEEVT
ncbi:MAG: phosphoribosylformylglycinamidine synthase subunit PurS [Acidimicrobiia bacterium]